MSNPKITIKVTNTTEHFYYDVNFGNKEQHRLNYHGGLIDSKHGLYFLATPYHGITETQRLFKLSEIEGIKVIEKTS